VTDSKIKSEVLSGIKWVAIGKASTQLISWFTTFWVIRLLLPEDYGIVALAMAITGLMLMLIDTCFIPIIIKNKDISAEALAKVTGLLTIVVLMFSGGLFLASDWVGQFYQSDKIALVLKVQIIGVICQGIEILPRALLNKEMDFKRVSIVIAVANILGAITTLSMAFNGFAFWSLVVGTLVTSVIRAIFIFRAKPISVVPSFDLTGIYSHLKFGGLLSVHGLLFYIFLYMDVSIAGKQLSIVEAGVWAVCVQIAMMPLKKILPFINQVAFPAFSSIQDDISKVGNYVLKAQRLSFVLTVPLFWGLASVIDLLIPLILGERWSPAAMPAMILLFAMPFRFSDELFFPALKSLGLAQHMIVNIIVVIVLLVLCFVVGLQYGLLGFACAWVIGYLSGFIIVVSRNLEVLHIEKSQYAKAIILPLFSGSAMFLSVYLVKLVVLSNAWLELLFAISMGAVVFLTFSFFTNKSIFKELKSLRG